MSQDTSLPTRYIESRIFTIRGMQVMLDRDLAAMYQVETRVLNQTVKRNIDRFPQAFCFQLTKEELQNWRSQFVTSNEDKMGLRRAPFAFTEQGVAMLSAVLRSDVAVQVSIQIMNAFIAMRQLLTIHSGLLQRFEGLEKKQLETDQKFEQIFRALERKDIIPNQGVFFDGQVFDAYELASRIIRAASKSIILIDNYVDETTLTHLAKKKKNVRVLLLTKKIGQQLTSDLSKANQQYGDFSALPFDKSHDRFLIIDEKEVYHLGASLKDLGKKWFAFSKMDQASVVSILDAVTTVQKSPSK